MMTVLAKRTLFLSAIFCWIAIAVPALASSSQSSNLNMMVPSDMSMGSRSSSLFAHRKLSKALKHCRQQCSTTFSTCTEDCNDESTKTKRKNCKTRCGEKRLRCQDKTCVREHGGSSCAEKCPSLVDDCIDEKDCSSKSGINETNCKVRCYKNKHSKVNKCIRECNSDSNNRTKKSTSKPTTAPTPEPYSEPQSEEENDGTDGSNNDDADDGNDDESDAEPEPTTDDGDDNE